MGESDGVVVGGSVDELDRFAAAESGVVGPADADGVVSSVVGDALAEADGESMSIRRKVAYGVAAAPRLGAGAEVRPTFGTRVVLLMLVHLPWIARSDGALLNIRSGQQTCLDDPGSSTTDNTQLQLATCGRAIDQEWNTP